MLNEFKKFAVKGNVLDLAVAVIIGGAFGKIVTSFVNDVIMPIVGILMGQNSVADLKYVITPATETTAELAIRYGAFAQAIVDFIIVAFILFLAIKTITSMKKKEEEAPAPPPEPSEDVVLLTEIRDLLKNK
ncbi:MAG: large-conductance mechanosensitive channel protein MscL [Clostridia bacterium]|nr:large-conductance mechanosensitive channel protein MscL [Clostridia bacterium]